MAHIDFQMSFLKYNLAQVYLDMCDEDPRLNNDDIRVPLWTDFILGRFFTHEIQECLLLALLDNSRTISFSLHPMMASRVSFALANESKFQAGIELKGWEKFMVQDSVCEINYFDYERSNSLRSLVSLLSYEHQMTDIDVGEVTFYQIYGNLLEKVRQGYIRFQIHIPQSMLNDVNLYGNFALEASL